MKRGIAVLISVIFFASVWQQTYAQQKTVIDSLNKVANNRKLNPKANIDALTQLAKLYYRTDSAKNYHYALKAKALAEKLDYKLGIADAITAMGMYHATKTDFKKALGVFSQANAYYKSLNQENQIASNYGHIGTMYKLASKYVDALDYSMRAEAIHRKNKNLVSLTSDLTEIGAIYSETDRKSEAVTVLIEALSYADKLNDVVAVARLQVNIGNLLREQKNYSEAIAYYEKAINVYKRLTDQTNIGIARINISIAYAELHKYDLAVKYAQQAVDVFSVVKFDRGLIFGYNNLGGINIRMEKYLEALPYLNQAEEVSRKSNNFSILATILENKAFVLTNLKQYNEAEQLFIAAETAAIKYKNRIGIFGNIYNHWSTLDSVQGNFKQALQHHKQYVKIKDSTLNSTLSSQINNLQLKYETEKKEKQIVLLNKENTIKALKLSQVGLEYENQQLELGKTQLQLDFQDLELIRKENLLTRNQFEAAKKKQEINTLNQENTIQKLKIDKRDTAILIVIILFGLTVVLAALFYNRYKLKQEALLAQEKLTQIKLTTKAVLEAEENERKRIASDLHDGVGQMFSAVKMNLSGLIDRIEMPRKEDQFLAEKTLALVEESCKEVRIISHKMMPNFLLKSGIAADIRSFIEKVDEQSLRINFETEGFSNQLEYSEEVILYRVIQELVNNVIKHAKASELSILLKKIGSEIFVELSDNGVGFDYHKISKMEGLGLKNIKVRIDYLKGTFKYSANYPKGTTVRINIPVA